MAGHSGLIRRIKHDGLGIPLRVKYKYRQLPTANETFVTSLLSKPLRLEDIVIYSTLLQEINCYLISWNRNNTPDENIKTELRAITMNDLVKAVDRSLSASSSTLKT